MRTRSLLLVAATLLLLGAGCAGHDQQGAVSTSAKDWQKTPVPQAYLNEMRNHPPGPPAVHGGAPGAPTSAPANP